MAIIHLDDSVEFVKEIGAFASADEVARLIFCECTFALTPALSHPMGEGEVVPALSRVETGLLGGSRRARSDAPYQRAGNFTRA